MSEKALYQYIYLTECEVTISKTSLGAEEKRHEILKCGFNPHKATVHDVAQYKSVFLRL
jgi:hypothetical protein